jgi:hypothetical protein
MFLIVAAVLTFSGSRTDAYTDPEARQVLADYSKCVVQNARKQAEAVVLSTPKNRASRADFAAVIRPDCLGHGRLSLPGGFIRYGLAEALVRQEYRHGLPADIDEAAPLEHPRVNDAPLQPKPGMKQNVLEALERSRANAVGEYNLSVLGECVARKNPQGSLQLVLSWADTDDETRALGALTQSIADCLDPGETATLDRTSLRGAIALELYRLAKAPRLKQAPTTR